jgi:hypothetical protein
MRHVDKRVRFIHCPVPDCKEFVLPERLDNHIVIAHTVLGQRRTGYFQHDTMRRLNQYEQQIAGRRQS